MGQKKLKRFAEIAQFEHVLEYPKNMQGNWHTVFKNHNPITVELACGKGEYSIGLANLYPDQNFVGVDVKGNRIWVGAKKAIDMQLNNVAFLRTQIGMINDYFTSSEVSEIWIPFPDPQLRISKAKKRLTHPAFLRKYQQFLKPNGFIHLKTDSPVLYQFTKTVIQLYGLKLFEDLGDIRNDLKQKPELSIKTHYEGLNIAKSNRIYYLKFALDANIDESKDVVLAELIKSLETKSEVKQTEHEEKTN
jgi:tRNA (guanine-N7-)-methyltransferase